MVEKKKRIGYYASRKRCLRAYSQKKVNKRTRRKTVRKVNSSGKVLKKGTKIFKTKSACKRYINRRRRSPVRRRRRRSPVRRRRRRSPVRRRRRRTRFGKGCGEYVVPYFGQNVPNISPYWSGGPPYTSSAWMWPGKPGAEALSKQQGQIIGKNQPH